MSKAKSALSCDHANEVPVSCPCKKDCYCRRKGSCREKKVAEASNYDTGKSVKERQGTHTITLRKPHALWSVPACDCWHEGVWLFFRVKKSDGSFLVHKVAPWRVVGVSWVEELERGRD